MNALEKIKILVRCKKIKPTKMNLVVIRTNKRGDLCNSAPCYHCTLMLSKEKYIKINKLYYSKSDGNMECIKFDDWINSGTSHVSKGWKWMKKNS
jgi:hypothetical protein